MITANDFIAQALWICKNLNTVYALGMWGWQVNNKTVAQKAKQLPSFYTSGKIAFLNSLSGAWGFDCVCLIKAILWGFGSDLNDVHGGAKYASNGVPDFGADGVKNHCTLYTTDFSIIRPGAVLHMPGHVGIYIGDGLAVECTAAWESKVIITAVGNIGKKLGYHTRHWDEWGLLKYVNYSTDVPSVDKRLDVLETRVSELEKPLTVYHYWYEIEQKISWAYKPLRALYDAGLFAGASASDLNVNREKVEMLVCLAAALKKYGFLKY